MFRDVTAIGASSWAPASGLMHPLYSQNATITEDDDSAENEQFDGDHEKIGYSIHQDKVVEPTRKQLSCELMTPLFKLGLGLFTKKANKEIFVALKELKYQIEWLKDQQYQL
ncbi:Hypothetical predicted protein [Olea europaea subsp. europaea]|uniref:Uncharacterized protein n=1 Tax=Olea europaea subsp. europaea TaxID=158383 RepID=A0A8S0RL46_OLEEU|nr:Hypothetical predicted protein [Olea europaea subsp. europaea]